MGQQFALVSMTNKDVYHVTQTDGRKILMLLGRPNATGFFQTVDSKTGATVSIAVNHVSSVVVQEGGFARG